MARSSSSISAPQGNWVEKLLPVGEERFVSGTIGFFNGMKQITHPDYVVDVADFETMPLVEPVYPLTHGLTTKALTKLVRATLETLPDLPEWIVPGPHGRSSAGRPSAKR